MPSNNKRIWISLDTYNKLNEIAQKTGKDIKSIIGDLVSKYGNIYINEVRGKNKARSQVVGPKSATAPSKPTSSSVLNANNIVELITREPTILGYRIIVPYYGRKVMFILSNEEWKLFKETLAKCCEPTKEPILKALPSEKLMWLFRVLYDTFCVKYSIELHMWKMDYSCFELIPIIV